MPFVSSVRGSYGTQGRRRPQTGRIGTGTTGGSITEAGGYRIHTFTSVGTSTFIPDQGGPVEYLIVAGGGGTGWDVGGGGGAGGLLSGTFSASATNYTVVVGDGGNSHPGGSNSKGDNGGNSSALGQTAIGGGGGGAYPTEGIGKNGGSGGGGGQAPVNAAGGSGTPGQGFAGGASSGASYGSGAGGGAGGVGSTGITNQAVNGGAHVTSSISGSSVNYAGGGYGNSDSGPVYTTGHDQNNNFRGFYGYGSNGAGPTGIKANPGIVIIRYPI
jgi:hypothetical protein